MAGKTDADNAAEHLRQQIARDTSSVTAPGWETQNAIGHLLDERDQRERDRDSAHKRG